MEFSYLDKEEFKNVPLYRMQDNRHGDLPFFIRKYDLNSKTKLHRHEYMQINYICRGKAKHIINRQEFTILKGDIFVIPPYVPHAINSCEVSDVEIFEFEFVPEFINPYLKNIQNADSFLDFAYIEPFLVSENLVKPRLNLIGKLQIEVESILQEVLREYQENKPGAILLIKSLLLKLLVLVGREFSSNIDSVEVRSIYDRHRDAILGAVKYMGEHYRENLSVEIVAREFMLSQSYFSYLFKSITSKTFTEYLNSLRISKAMELLKNTNERVLDICLDAGFNNINHFNRMFRQQLGMSPLDYRKST